VRVRLYAVNTAERHATVPLPLPSATGSTAYQSYIRQIINRLTADVKKTLLENDMSFFFPYFVASIENDYYLKFEIRTNK
jgi:hypothetical protein